MGTERPDHPCRVDPVKEQQRTQLRKPATRGDRVYAIAIRKSSMKRDFSSSSWRASRFAILICAATAWAQPLPVRGIHLAAPMPDEIPLAERFIKEALPKEGVNVLVLEVNYRYQFVKHPEVTDDRPLSRDDIGRLAAACRASGVRLIPMINVLGHQSWARPRSACCAATRSSTKRPANSPTTRARIAAAIVRCIRKYTPCCST